jgi:hypothetical protein
MSITVAHEAQKPLQIPLKLPIGQENIWSLCRFEQSLVNTTCCSFTCIIMNYKVSVTCEFVNWKQWVLKQYLSSEYQGTKKQK